MNEARYAAVILAAGFSSRMGRFKPLIRLDRYTVTERLIALYQAHHTDVYLVVGWNQAELKAALTIQPEAIVNNPAFAEGMFTSVRAGLQAVVQQPYQSVFIQPVDVPLVRGLTVRALRAAGDLNPERIIYPAFRQQRGHPTLLPRALVPQILAWSGEGGLRRFLAGCEELALEINLPDSNILFDIDTPEDLPELRERFRRLEIPGPEECRVILEDLLAVPEQVRRHCAAVTELAVEIGAALIERGQELDPDLIRASAALHDMCKTHPRHEQAAAAVLREMGFAPVAEVVENHTELGGASDHRLETKIVFLADKMVREDRRISLAERYAAAREKYPASSGAWENIGRREEEALRTRSEIEKILGRALE